MEDDYYVAMYPYESNEPGDLSFVAGEMVTITKKDGDWWTGIIGNRSGVFPSNYVQKAELQYEAAADSEVEAATAAADAAAAAAAAAVVSKAVAPVVAKTTNPSDFKRPSTAPIDGEFEVLYKTSDFHIVCRVCSFCSFRLGQSLVVCQNMSVVKCTLFIVENSQLLLESLELLPPLLVALLHHPIWYFFSHFSVLCRSKLSR